MAKCFSCNKHISISIVGLSLSFFELILASVYNLHMIGLGMSIIGIITSGLYLHFNIKDQKARHGSMVSSSADQSQNEVNEGESR
jgi:uncharacterized protein (DUF1499 family)